MSSASSGSLPRPLCGRSIFVYEFASACTALDGAEPLPESIVREGAAMLRAVVADFLLAGASASTICSLRSLDTEARGLTVHEPVSGESESALFCHLASSADWSLIIAPETDGVLTERCRLARRAGGRLLAPAQTDLELTADKHRTCLWLSERNVPTPNGFALNRGASVPTDVLLPAVLKPRIGAGSQNMRLMHTHDELPTATDFDSRVEQYCAGEAVSVSFFCGPEAIQALLPCRQHIASDGSFSYLGGELPVPAELSRRAIDLGKTAVATLSAPLGYIGVDLVLGDAADGTEDVVIEINPRLTTSYIGLRQATNVNLAEAMVAISDRHEVALSWRPGRVRWTADGQVRRDDG